MHTVVTELLTYGSIELLESLGLEEFFGSIPFISSRSNELTDGQTFAFPDLELHMLRDPSSTDLLLEIMYFLDPKDLAIAARVRLSSKIELI